eukprot:6634342-Alexandrium_andersonii.AAC.1
MSASLVGSEMCIRDRVSPQSKGLFHRAILHSPPATVWSRGSNKIRTAVSYTHLTLPTICSV